MKPVVGDIVFDEPTQKIIIHGVSGTTAFMLTEQQKAEIAPSGEVTAAAFHEWQRKAAEEDRQKADLAYKWAGQNGDDVSIKNDKIADLMDDTADILEKQGRCINSWTNPAGQVCLVEAMWRAQTKGQRWVGTRSDLTHGNSVLFSHAVRQAFGLESGDALHNWNDEQGPERDQFILDGLRKGAKDCRQ